eukprot:Unigene4438_Nuclearia_a/m.13560 Unigene4438_Nuclearia_a/g.13560  ORF Unigene4438_Nuclearia_a/g.13560 Unigene4438_Nuclearia_a/m.13560 type:complete len:472 (+) Unigene4438_Nuclearia_a:48-1463(+)
MRTGPMLLALAAAALLLLPAVLVATDAARVVVREPVPLAANTTGVPVFVMMPLAIVSPSNSSRLANPEQLRAWLGQVAVAGAEGVMCDFWWGVVEGAGPRKYDWAAYRELMGLVRAVDLDLNVVLSFHQCGGNVNDDCNIPLPSWVRSSSGIWYKDRAGIETREYISLGADEAPLADGRTPVQAYADYIASFIDAFRNELAAGVIDDVEVGMGPAGELRYPSYPLDRWTFPGVGEFQCYDGYMLESLRSAAAAIGRPEWGNGGPSNAGTYNSRPEDTGFFNSGFDNYASDYGRFFLEWYSGELLKHAERILAQATPQFAPFDDVVLSVKISGVHWLYNHPSHAAELTAGYYNTNGRNAYDELAQHFAPFNAAFDFTCLEMRNSEQPSEARANPEALVAQSRAAAFGRGVIYRGENALNRYDSTAYQQIVRQSKDSSGRKIDGFTYLRLSQTLLNEPNYSTFRSFVGDMSRL